MPELDKLTEKMAQRGVERVMLDAGQPMRLLTAGREATGPALPMQRLEAMVEEVTPAHLLPQLASGKPLSFPYQSPHGLFNVNVERSNGGLQVSIAPLGGGNNATPTPPPVAVAASRVRPTATPVVASPPPLSAPPQVDAPSSSKGTKLLPVAGGVAAALIVLGIIWSGNRGRVAREDAEQAQVQQAQAQQANDAHGKYLQEINGLSQISVVVTAEEYPLATENPKFGLVAVDLEKRVLADPTIDGSATSGKKGELIKALRDSLSRNAPLVKVAEINRQTEQKLRNHMLATGQQVLKEPTVQQAIISRKGVNAWLKLQEADDEAAFVQQVQGMFP